MTDAVRRYTDDVPDDLVARVRELCAELPETREEPAWKGTRWRVRTKTFAHVLGVEDGETGPSVVLAFRSTGEELEALRHAGPPFLVLGWGRDALGVVLDDGTDWDEIREVLTESYCALAPKKLVERIDRPDGS